MQYEHWDSRRVRVIITSSVLFCAIVCGANVVSAADLLLYNDFENGFTEGAKNSGWDRNTSPNVPDNWIDVSTGGARIGSKMLKTYLAYAAPDNNFRSEILLQNPRPFDFGKDYWFAFSIYVPSDWVAETAGWDDQVLMQFHGNAIETKPLGTIRIANGNWRSGIAGSDNVPYVGKEVITSSKVLGPVVPGTWNDFVVHVRFGYMSSQNPIWEIWKDGQLKWTYTGLTAHNESVGTYMKLGQYNIGWKYNTPTNITKRTYYYDEIKVMGPGATVAEISPGAVVAPPTTPVGLQLIIE